jgi:hypothetical protein
MLERIVLNFTWDTMYALRHLVEVTAIYAICEY